MARIGWRLARSIASLAAFFVAVLLVAPHQARAFNCASVEPIFSTKGNPFNLGLETFACAATASAGPTLVTSPNGPLTRELTGALAGPNGAAVASALGKLLGPSAFGQTATPALFGGVPFQTFTFFGPTTLPFGNGPGGINCTGVPTAWPPANCDMTGYQQLVLGAGRKGTIVDVHFIVTTTVNLGGANKVADWLMGDLHTEFQTAILDGDFAFVDGLMSHAGGPGSDPLLFSLVTTASAQFAQLGLSDSPPLSGAGPWATWFKGEYFSTSLAGTAANFGFDEHSHGGAGGADYREGDLLFGGALAYDHTDVTQNITTDHGGIGSWRLGGYGGWRPGPWSFTAVVGGGFHSIDADRLAMLPMPAHSSYGARTLDVAAEAARRFPLGMATLQPMAGLVYSRLDADRFGETGGLLDIAGRPATIDALKGYAGARIYQAFDLANGMRLLPEARARVMYDLLNTPRAFTATFVDDPTLSQFPVTGIQPPRLAGLFGASLSLGFTPACRAFVAYDAQLRGGEVAHLVSGGVRLTW